MGLNISIFGLTKNRFFVCLLMAAFGVVLIFFAIHLLAPKVPYMHPVIIICSAIFIAFAYFNSDNAIVKYNIAKYESGAISSIDGYYLSNLKVPSSRILPKSKKAAIIRPQTVHAVR